MDRLLRSYHLVRGEKGVRTVGGALDVWFTNLYSQPLGEVTLRRCDARAERSSALNRT